MPMAAIARFADDAAGLEKTLRLMQAFCTIALGLKIPAVYAPSWTKARAQFNLGRRYFRLHKWYPCWINAIRSTTANHSSVKALLEVTKWSFLGLYFFLEMFTLTNAMGITEYDWAARVQLESNKCWFYALVASILLSLYDLWLTKPLDLSGTHATSKTAARGSDVKSPVEKNARQVEKSGSSSSVGNRRIYMQMAIDCSDLFIPGTAVGWVGADQLTVGIAMSISTLLAAQQIWQRVQETTS